VFVSGGRLQPPPCSIGRLQVFSAGIRLEISRNDKHSSLFRPAAVAAEKRFCNVVAQVFHFKPKPVTDPDDVCPEPRPRQLPPRDDLFGSRIRFKRRISSLTPSEQAVQASDAVHQPGQGGDIVQQRAPLNRPPRLAQPEQGAPE
jgi:hypothetical protein